MNIINYLFQHKSAGQFRNLYSWDGSNSTSSSTISNTSSFFSNVKLVAN